MNLSTDHFEETACSALMNTAEPLPTRKEPTFTLHRLSKSAPMKLAAYLDEHRTVTGADLIKFGYKPLLFPEDD